MSYCLNPTCSHPQNPDNHNFCQSCGFKLLLRERYQALKPIGQGGFGKTFLGVDCDKPSKPPCVIKLFLPSSQGTDSIEKAKQLFNQEAERLETLGKHHQIPELLAHFAQEGKLYLVQEYIEGQNLEAILRDGGKWQEREIRELLTGLLPVLSYVHQNNVIHRDIKPENIIRRNNGEYVLVDFGAARYVTGTALLQTGTVIGDPRYMADEQIQGRAVFASDLYSLGLTCLHLLTLMEPWDLFDTSEGEWVWRDYVTTPISDGLAQVLDKLVQKPIKRRFQGAEAVLEALGMPSVTTSSTPVKPPLSQPSVTTSSTPVKPPLSQPSQSSKMIKQGNKWGYADETGKIVIPAQFDDVWPFSDGLARVTLNGKWGCIDQTGKIVIPFQFDEMGMFSEGLAKVKLKGEWGYIDQTGKIVIPFQFDYAWQFSEGLARVRLKNKWGYIDRTGKIVISLRFDDVWPFSEGLAKVRVNNKYGYIDQTGKIVISPRFDEAYDFSNGSAKVKIEGFLGFGEKKGRIDKQGNWI